MSVTGQTFAGLSLLGLNLALILGLSLAGSGLVLSSEVKRKLVHVLTGLSAIALPWVLPDDRVFYAVLAVAAVTLLGLRLLRHRKIACALHGVDRSSFGELYILGSIALLHLIADGNAILYILPLAILTFCDPAAALVGIRFGRHLFQVAESQKSLEGCAAFFLTATCVCAVGLLLLTNSSGLDIVLITGVLAVFATLIEADSWRGTDNLFLPVGVALILHRILHLAPEQIALHGLMFALLWLATFIVAQLAGLRGHRARLLATALVLILSVTGWVDLILPALAIAAHLFARRQYRWGGAEAELQLVGGLAFLGLISLGVALEWHVDPINAFSLAVGCLAAMLLGLNFVRQGGVSGLLAGAVSAGSVFLIWDALMQKTSPEAFWHGAHLIAALALFAGLTLTTMLFHTKLGAGRNQTLAALSGFGALALYALLMSTGATA